MTYRLLNDNGQKTWALILDSGDEAVRSLQEFANEVQIHSAQFTAIGAFSEATTGFYDFSVKDYHKNLVSEQVEVLNITGDISHYQGKVHAHAVLGKRDGTACGGHLLKGLVHPTLEVMVTESPAWLERQLDEASGIPLIRVEDRC